VDGDSSQPPHFPTLPRLTSSANRKNPTQQPLRTQQPQCAESTAARPKERLPGAMTIQALILRANNALFPEFEVNGRWLRGVSCCEVQY
jgi:hypothetical protein